MLIIIFPNQHIHTVKNDKKYTDRKDQQLRFARDCYHHMGLTTWIVRGCRSSELDAGKPGKSLLHDVNDLVNANCLYQRHWQTFVSRRILENWWSQTGSNRRPHACKARALPTELWPRPDIQEWWAWVDLNYRPHAYQACALTN